MLATVEPAEAGTIASSIATETVDFVVIPVVDLRFLPLVVFLSSVVVVVLDEEDEVEEVLVLSSIISS